MGINFTIEDRTEEVKSRVNAAMVEALETVGLLAEGYAKAICPVDTGRLRNSITHAVDENAVVIGSNVEYAPYIELGRSKQAPNGFLGPAVSSHMDQFKTVIQAKLSDVSS